MIEFSTINKIQVDDPNTWYGKVFLTFDIDWANDEIIGDVINLVERSDVPATWFITHSSDILDRLRENPKIEIGIHPNFNLLLNGTQ